MRELPGKGVHPQTPRPPLAFSKKVVFSLVATLLFFAFLELGLRLIGFSPVTRKEDPWVGFSNRIPLLEETTGDDGQPVMMTAANKLVWFNDFRFPRQKPPKTFRIFSLGGSTTYGHPYWDNTSFSRWMREYLPVIDPSYDWEVINAGGISYASYRVATVMEELSQYEPDLFVVYSAHNEFLERRTYAAMFEQSAWQRQFHSLAAKTRTWAAIDALISKSRALVAKGKEGGQAPELLGGEVDEMLNHTIGPIDYHRDELWKKRVLQHYEWNLERMVYLANRCGAKLIFVTPASNAKNCAPFKSEPAPHLSEPERRRLEELVTLGRQALVDDDEVLARERYENILRMDAEYAEASYRLGHIAIHQRDYEAAYRLFRNAINHDVCPLRAVDGITEAIRRVATTFRIPVVDFESRLTEVCRQEQGHAIFGEEYFLDHVHPTVDVNRRLSQWIIQAMQAQGWVAQRSFDDEHIAAQFAQIRSKVESELDATTHGIAFRNLAKVIHWAGRYEESVGLAEDALEFLPDDPESRFVLADSLKNLGRYDDALAQYELLFEGDKIFERAYHPFGELLAFQGQWTRAKAYLLLASLRKPSDPQIFYSLGEVHLQLAEFDLAEESLEKARRAYPAHAPTQFLLAQAKAGNQKLDEATAILRQILDAGYDLAPVHNELGRILLKQGKVEEAIESFTTALQLDPELADAQRNLQSAIEL